MHNGLATRVLEKTKRAISPGRMSSKKNESVVDQYKDWFGDPTPVLRYHNSAITRHDITTLIDETGWLEDNLIHFWMEYLENEELYSFPRANILLIQPSMASMIKTWPLADTAPALAQIGSLKRGEVTHVIMPVNTDSPEDHDLFGRSDDRPTITGIHWALLVVSLLDNVAFYYDSSPGIMAFRHAEVQLANFQAALPGKPRKIKLVQMRDTPQQADGWNCGVFATVFMKHLLVKRLLKADAHTKIDMSLKGRDIDFVKARKAMHAMIIERRDEAIKRGSLSDDGVPWIVRGKPRYWDGMADSPFGK